jgi:hypothetical protein
MLAGSSKEAVIDSAHALAAPLDAWLGGIAYAFDTVAGFGIGVLAYQLAAGPASELPLKAATIADVSTWRACLSGLPRVPSGRPRVSAGLHEFLEQRSRRFRFDEVLTVTVATGGGTLVRLGFPGVRRPVSAFEAQLLGELADRLVIALDPRTVISRSTARGW